MCMMCYLRLALLLPDLCHESTMNFGTKLALLETSAMRLLGVGILVRHVVHHVEERRAGARALGVLTTIFASILHCTLLRSYGLSIGIPLQEQTHTWQVIIHHATISANTTMPQVRMVQGLLDGSLLWLEDQVSRVTTFTIPHIGSTL